MCCEHYVEVFPLRGPFFLVVFWICMWPSMVEANVKNQVVSIDESNYDATLSLNVKDFM